MNTLYNDENERIAILRLGVLWEKSNRGKMGEYDERGFYYPNKRQIASFDGDKVFSMDGRYLGKFSINKEKMTNFELYNYKYLLEIEGVEGYYSTGSKLAALACIAYLVLFHLRIQEQA